MSNVNLFNGITITVEGTSNEYHSYDDWGLYVTNTDCIGEPKQYTKYLQIPGRNGQLDLSQTISGRPIFISREIKINLAGTRFRTNWDAVISTFRNAIAGRVCRITFDNDPSYFWKGKVDVKGFESVMNLGTFSIELPEADPYKYDITSSADPWLWDPFNFNTGVITQIGAKVITVSGSITILHGHMATCPEIVVSDKLSSEFTVIYGNISYPLSVGTNRVPAIMVSGETDVTLDFIGSATVQVVYRGGSL